MTQFLTAFGAGVTSFFSPCILPLLPGYLSMLSGFTAGEITRGEAGVETGRVVGRAAVFVLGFTLAFSIMGAAASSLGGLLATHKDLLLKIFGVIMALLGLHMTGALNFNALNYEKRFFRHTVARGHHGALLMGFAFALGWSPCIGPILAVILGMAAVAGTVWKGVALLLAYSAGMAVPLLTAAFLTARFFKFMARYKHAMRWVELVAGVVLIALGCAVFLDKLMFVA